MHLTNFFSVDHTLHFTRKGLSGALRKTVWSDCSIKMARQRISLALLATILMASCWNSMLTIATEDVEDEYEDVERAHLIVRKFTNDELVVQGRNVTVTLEIFNGGPAWVLRAWIWASWDGSDDDDLACRSAKNIELKDTLPPGSTLIEGSTEATYPVISSGSSVKTSYVMKFITGGSGFALPVATVTYEPDPDSKQVRFWRKSISILTWGITSLSGLHRLDTPALWGYLLWHQFSKSLDMRWLRWVL